MSDKPTLVLYAWPKIKRILQTHCCYVDTFAKHLSYVFLLQLEVGYPLPTEHVQFLMERILHGLLHSPFPRIDVMITLGIGDVDTPLNRFFSRIFLDYVLPEEIQDHCSIFIVYHQRDIYDYRLESVILM